MLNDLPLYVPVIFGLTTLATLLFFHWILLNSAYKKQANFITGGLVIWIILQSIISRTLFYVTNLDRLPPRFVLAILPTLVLILALFFTERGRKFIDSLPLKNITYLNIVRIPVEICLYWLALGKAIPELMTFAGRNFDILAGITAPLVAYFGFEKGKLNKQFILVWNFFALGLLLFIVMNALLSAPVPFQQFAFEQPNIAVLHFPYILLPAFIVPIVLFGHFVSIRRLLNGE